jgi:type II secretion system protein H
MPATVRFRREFRRGVRLALEVAVTRNARGFSLLEVLVVIAVIGTVAAISVPSTLGALRRYRLDGTSREVAAQIATARLQAVTTNRAMRVRLNCPAANQYRVVEVTGDAAIDSALDRCDTTAYAYPDADPATRPDLDGPLRFMAQGTSFGAVQEIEISTRGRVMPLTGALPAVIEVTDGIETRQVRISQSGHIQIQ